MTITRLTFDTKIHICFLEEPCNDVKKALREIGYHQDKKFNTWFAGSSYRKLKNALLAGTVYEARR